MGLVKFGEIGIGCVTENGKNQNISTENCKIVKIATCTKSRQNVKQGKSLRWWEVQQSKNRGSMWAPTTPSGFVKNLPQDFLQANLRAKDFPQANLRPTASGLPSENLLPLGLPLENLLGAFSQNPRALWELTWTLHFSTVLPPTTLGFSPLYTRQIVSQSN